MTAQGEMSSTDISTRADFAQRHYTMDGRVKGLCARGGFVVDMDWKGGKVTSLSVFSRKGGTTTVSFNGTSKTVSLKEGETRKIM